MEELLSLMLHADEMISEVVSRYGTMTYLIVFAIIFIETGLVVVTFFPGDGLLFSLGVLAAAGDLNLGILLILLALATFLGHTSNYLIGRFLGGRFFRKAKAQRSLYLSKANHYYEKHGGTAIIWSRFFPFLRSFVPFVAGMAKMNMAHFTWCNILGGAIWICSYLLLGYFFGEIPWVKENYGLVFSVMIVFVLLALLVAVGHALLQNRLGKKSPSP